MRDDPYPARFYGRQVDEPFLSDLVTTLPGHAATLPLPQPAPRILLLLMMAYLGCALFLIFTVSSYAAPLGSATMASPIAAFCAETDAIAAR